jgi:hypothetical protein
VCVRGFLKIIKTNGRFTVHHDSATPAQTGAVSPWMVLAAAFVAAVLIVGYAFSSGPVQLTWVAESRGLIGLAQDSGLAAVEIPLAPDARAVAVDGQTQTVWTFTGLALRSFTARGEPRSTTSLLPPIGNPAILRVDPQAGRVWLAVHSQIWLFDARGAVLAQFRLPNPVIGMALDRRKSRLWVASKEALAVYDQEGRQVLQVDVDGAKVIRALDYDLSSGEVWFLADESLRRYAPDGHPTFSSRSTWFSSVAFLAADQKGGLWAASSRELAHLNGAGGIDARLTPAGAANADFIVDLVADARDHTAWLATQRSVSHYGAGGVLFADFPVGGADGKTRLVRQLAIETPRVAPEIRFASPANDALLNAARPSFRVTYAGDDIDLDSLAFASDGAELPTLCEAQAATATCVASAALADGAHAITATIANRAGSLSEPAVLHLTIDTVAPQITVSSPPAGFLTNQLAIQLTGQVDEPWALTINGSAVPLNGNRFSWGPVDLSEGLNGFELVAQDRAGNVGTQSFTVIRDTVPPAAPVPGTIAARVSDDEVAVVGSAGSVEAGARVTIVNLATGDRVTVTANADGSFSATLPGGSGDALQIYATDGAGNQGGASDTGVASGGPFSGPIRIGAVSPASGATVNADFILVTLDLQAPPNTGVTVNGVVAAAVPAESGLRYVAEVPLKTGQNTLRVLARSQDGRTVEREVSVTSTGPFPYRIFSHRQAGAAPFDAAIEVWDQLGYGIRRIDVDFDGDGAVDLSTDGGGDIATTYTGVGVRQARVTVFDDAMDAHTKLVTFVLLDPGAVDGNIQALWSGMNTALVSGDKAAALAFLSDQARDQYGPVFDALLPHMPEIVASYSPLKRSSISASYTEYGVNRVIDGTKRVFLVGFVVNEFGQWQLDSM